MTFRGAFSLKKNGSPGCNTLKVDSDPGRQKFTSSTGGSIARR